MKLSEIEAAGEITTIYDSDNYKWTGIVADRTLANYGSASDYQDKRALDFEKSRKVYTAEQMKEYAEVKRDYILIIDGGIGTKLYATDRFTGTEAVDVYGDKYKVVNHVKNGKMWVLDNEEDTKND